jgi:hypothetical protein
MQKLLNVARTVRTLFDSFCRIRSTMFRLYLLTAVVVHDITTLVSLSSEVRCSVATDASSVDRSLQLSHVDHS